ncbi:MAG: filamentous hemagglutinin N-terminal domain-containing protein [Phormidium sp. SL48-SHIP]|nr:MAG: filamentous hemagglutinin N-terminal domain-containing protein [Phormidium sp. SL48-SHIP]
MMENWQWGWVVSLGLGMAIVPILPIQAQIIPDSSLGNERSVTTPTETGVQIDGGALRGDNLFHSFQEFSIPTNSEAFFNNPDIANIFSRVTGGSISDIDGLLRANGTANLFLLNPNGIIFGPNARLDIGGSFVASTANSLVFENGLEFNASDSGDTAPLLSVNVPLGVQFNNPGRIEATGATLNVSEGESMALVGGEISLNDVEINAPAGRIDLVGVGEAGQVSFEVGDINSGFPSFGVPAELSRASVSLDETNLNVVGLVGGEIGIQALDIEMRDSVLEGGIAEGLGIEGGQSGNIELDAIANITISDSQLNNEVREGSIGHAGDINLVANTVEVTNGARLISGTTGRGNTGSITINANDSIVVSGSNSDEFSSGVNVLVGEGGQGNAGQINLISQVIEISNSAFILSSTFGEGNAGNVSLEAGETVRFLNGDIFSNVTETGRGNAGNIRIIGKRVEVREGAQLISDTSGQGNAGRIDIQATEAIVFSGENVDGFSSAAFSDVDTTGQGDAGEINLLGHSIEISNGARLSSSTFGEGNAGNVSLEAEETVRFLNGDIFSNVTETGRGNAGNIRVIGKRVEVREGAQLSSSTSGQGNGGRIDIQGTEAIIFSGENAEGFPSAAFSRVRETGQGDADEINLLGHSIEVSNGARLSSSTLGEGNAGNVSLEAGETVRFLNGDIFSNVTETGRGNAGNIRIIGKRVEVREGAQLSSSTSAQGNGGRIDIQGTEAIIFSGENAEGFPSGAFSRVQEMGQGDAVQINLRGHSIEVSNGARLSSSTFGEGNAGNITLEAGETVRFLNGNVFSNVEETGRGNAGNIRVIGERVELQDGARLSSSTSGEGNAGRITVEARDTAQFSNANIFSTVEAGAEGNGGDIRILGNTLFVEEGAQLNANTLGNGNAGTVRIEANHRVVFSGINADGSRSRVSSTVAESGLGNGGGISIFTNLLEVRDGAGLDSSTFGEGNAGRITVEASESVLFANGFASAVVGENARGNAGGVNIIANSLEVRDGSQLNSITLGQGNAGTIRVEANDRVIFSGVDPQGVPSVGLTSVGQTGQGDAGAVSIIANRVELRDGAGLDSSSLGQGNAGTVSIEVSETLLLSNGFVGSGVGETGRGNAGNVTVVADRLEVYDGALSSSSLSQGDAGTVTVEVHDTAIFASVHSQDFPVGLSSTIEETGQGNAGGVNLIAGTVELRDGTGLSSSNNATSNANDFTAGDVFVQADRLHLSDRADISANTGGRGGNVRLDTGTTILRRGSTIQTNAEGDFPGGNIIIDTDALVALENSDITANAINAAGGRVIINTQGIFGTEFRDELTPESDITATSDLGAEFSGSVELNTPDVDTATGLVDLSANPVDVAAILDTDPCTEGRESEFYVTGRGGLPPNPDGFLAAEATWLDWRSREEDSSDTTMIQDEDTASLVEAQGWHVNGDGAVVLSTQTPDGSPTPPQTTPAHCSPEQISR